MQKLQTPAQKKLAVTAGIVVLAALGFTAATATSGPSVPHQNLFALIGNMNSTTNQVLDHTSMLRKQVEDVGAQLQPINNQSALLKQQLSTGDELASQLNTQVSLTSNGVHLMSEILGRQKVTADLTHSIAAKSDELAGTVAQSANTLGELNGAVKDSLNGSYSLQQKLVSLLNEMSVSEDTFKVFGQVKSLLGQLPLGSGLLGNGLLGSGLPGSGSNGNGLSGNGLLGHTTPTAPATPTSPNNPLDGLTNLLPIG